MAKIVALLLFCSHSAWADQILIQSNPSGAAIKVNGQESHLVTPSLVPAKLGDTISLSKGGCDSKDAKVAGRRLNIVLSCARAAQDALLVVTEPSGAKVLVDGQYFSDSPCRISQFRIGSKVTLQKDGYVDFDVAPATVSDLRVTLKRSKGP